MHHLVSYHQKQKLVNFELKQILDFSKNEIKPIELHYENVVDSIVTINFEERLKRVVVSENKIDAAFQKQVFEWLSSYRKSQHTAINKARNRNLRC